MPIFLFIVAGIAVVMALFTLIDIANGAVESAGRSWGVAAGFMAMAALCIAGAALLEANSCT